MSGDLGRLVLQFAADVAGFQSDLGRVERAADRSARDTARSYDRAMSGIASSIKSAALQMGAALAAAFTVNALKDFVGSAIEVADKIKEISIKTGVTTESLSGLRFAAEQSGVKFDELSAALIKLEVNSVAAASGNEKLNGLFKALGVSVTDATGQVKAGDVLFKELAATFSQLENGPLKNAAGIEIFGKSFAKLIPLLNEGPQGLAKFNAEAERLGIIVNDDTASNAQAFGDAVDAIKSAASGAALVLAQEMLPALIQAAEKLTDFIVSAKDSGQLSALADLLTAMIETVLGVVFVFSKAAEGFTTLKQTFEDVTGITAANKLFRDLAESILLVSVAQSQATKFGDIKNGARNTVGGGVVSEGIQNAGFGTAKKQLSEFDGVVKNIRAALASVGTAASTAAPKVKEFVEAVRVLSINKEAVGTTKELRDKIRDLREQLNPTLRVIRLYEVEVKKLTDSTKADVNQTERNERALKKLDAQHRRNLATAKETVSTSGDVISSLQREVDAIKGGTLAREELAAALRIEEEYRRKVAEQAAINGDVSDTEKEKIRELVTELDKLANYKAFDLGTAISDSISAGMKTASVSEGFKTFFKKLKDAFSKGPEGIAGAVASIATGLSTIITAAQNSDGNSTGAGIRAGVGLLADAGNVFAQAALAIDTLFKGRLFGTDFTRQSQRNTSAFGADGFSGTTQTTDTRQRSFFRGRQTRVTNSQADAAALEAGAEFQTALDDIARTISAAFGTDLSARVNASFVQNFDANGLVSTIATVGGRAVAAGTKTAFERFLTAQTIIDALAASIPNLDALANPFRSTGAALLEFAQFAFAAQTDLARGAGLLGTGSGFAELLPIIQGLATGSESLVETYRRVFESVNLLDEALAAIGQTTRLTRVEFVNFSANLVTALGGIKEATEIIGRNLAEFFSPTELRATRLSGARTRLSAIGESSGLAGISNDKFKELLSQALSGAFDAERTAEILAYGDALLTVNGLVRETTAATEAAAQAETDRIAAIALATTSLSDFVTSLQDIAADGSLTNYQRTMRSLNRQFDANSESLNDLARQAGLTAAPIEGVTANLSILAQGAARALGDLKVTVLRGLNDLFAVDVSEQQAAADAFNAIVYGNVVATHDWAEQLKELEALQSAQDLARDIADLFKASGLSFADGVAEYGIPLRGLLDQLGVDFANLTSPASVAAFGAAAGLLGLTVDELAALSGIDLSSLTQAQRDALDIAAKPQVQAAESSAKSLGSIDEKSTSMITILMQQRTEAQVQSEALIRLGLNVNSLADEMRRIANRVPA